MWVQVPSSAPYADMVELADTHDSGSCAERHAGSSPVIRTIESPHKPSVYAGFSYLSIGTAGIKTTAVLLFFSIVITVFMITRPYSRQEMRVIKP